MKYYGAIGFYFDEETDPVNNPGVFKQYIVEKNYYGDVLKNYHKNDRGTSVNVDFNIDNRISIIADTYALRNIGIARYVTFMGEKWSISSAEVDYPRLIFTLGGLYHGPESRSSCGTCESSR